MKAKFQFNKGFTLIELLVVVAIIGILAAVGVVAYNGYTSSAKKNVVKSRYKEVIKFTKLGITKCDIGDEFKLKQSTSLTSWVWRTNQCSKVSNPTSQNLDELVSYIGGHFQAERLYNPFKNFHPEYGVVGGTNSSSCNKGEVCLHFETSPVSIVVSAKVDDDELLINKILLE